MIISDYYKLLGVSPKASQDELKRAYRSLARQHHPDINPSEETQTLFAAINEAYEVLSDPERRNEYNKSNGYQFFEEVDLGGTLPPESDPFDDDDFDDKQEQSSSRKVSIQAATSLESLRSKTGDVDLKVSHKVALNQPEETPDEESEEDEVGAWGEVLEKGKRFWGKKNSKGIRGLFQREDVDEKRGRLKDAMLSRMEEERHPKRPARPQRQEVRPETAEDAGNAGNTFRGDRVFHFVISNVEQALGAVREIALERRPGEDSTKVKVQIPAGVQDGEVIEVSRGWERFQAKISVTPDAHTRMLGRDIYLKFPVSIAEAANGAQLRVPLIGGSMPVTVAAGCQHICLAGKGLPSARGGTHGDMHVFPMVSLPSDLPDLVQSAIEMVEAQYQSSPRQALIENPDHPEFVHRSDEVSLLIIPVTLKEAIRGVQVSLAGLVDGIDSVSIPGNAPTGYEERLQTEHGTVIVIPTITLPRPLTAECRAAVEFIDSQYKSAVRSGLPQKLA